MEINYTLHTYDEGPTPVNAIVAGVEQQVALFGATVELTDDMGNCHTYRFADVMAARAMFGPEVAEIGSRFTCVLAPAT